MLCAKLWSEDSSESNDHISHLILSCSPTVSNLKYGQIRFMRCCGSPGGYSIITTGVCWQFISMLLL